MARTHFTGLLPRSSYLKVLQGSSLHMYLTIPFVLSWSMMEAMSAGCALLASNTAPVQEMLSDGIHGLTVDMKNPDAVAERAIYMLDNPDLRLSLGNAAREAMVKHYAQHDMLPKKLAMLTDILSQ